LTIIGLGFAIGVGLLATGTAFVSIYEITASGVFHVLLVVVQFSLLNVYCQFEVCIIVYVDQIGATCFIGVNQSQVFNKLLIIFVQLILSKTKLSSSCKIDNCLLYLSFNHELLKELILFLILFVALDIISDILPNIVFICVSVLDIPTILL